MPARRCGGQGVPVPLIVIENIQLHASDVMIMGKNKDHIKFNLAGVDCVKFFAKDLIAQRYKTYSKSPFWKRSRQRVARVESLPQIMIKDYEVIDNTSGF